MKSSAFPLPRKMLTKKECKERGLVHGWYAWKVTTGKGPNINVQKAK